MSFASRLKEQRERMGLTQAALAAKLGITKGAVGNYETGLNSPKAEILFKVFEVLHCDANYLFQDEMSSLREDTASPDEMELLVKKFRRLDAVSQKVVLTVLDLELQRQSADSETPVPSRESFRTQKAPSYEGAFCVCAKSVNPRPDAAQ